MFVALRYYCRDGGDRHAVLAHPTVLRTKRNLIVLTALTCSSPSAFGHSVAPMVRRRDARPQLGFVRVPACMRGP